MNKSRLNKWMSSYSLEVGGKEIETLKNVKNFLPNNIKIYLPHIQGKNFETEVIKPAEQINKLGYKTIPHLAARNIKDEAELESYLKAIHNLGIKEVLLLGGGSNPPAGNMTSTMDLLKSGLLTKYAIKTIGVAGHPEKHSQVSEEILMQALKDKQEFAKLNKLKIYILTQFCFSPDPVISWLQKLKTAKINIPIKLGVVGIVGIVALIKYAIYCGVGNSLQVIKDKYKNILQIASKYHNEDFFLPLLEVLTDSHPEVEGLHVFTFGSSEKTVKYFKEWFDKTTS